MILSATAQIFAFGALSLIAVLGALGMATTMSMYRSGIFLMASFIGVSGLFILLSADLLGLLQIMMYIGGMLVMVLFMVLFSHDPGGNMMAGMEMSWVEKAFSLGLLPKDEGEVEAESVEELPDREGNGPRDNGESDEDEGSSHGTHQHGGEAVAETETDEADDENAHPKESHKGHQKGEHSGHDMSGHDMSGHDMSGHDMKDQTADENDMKGHDMEGHNMKGHDMADEDMAGHDMSGHDHGAMDMGDMDHSAMDHGGMDMSMVTPVRPWAAVLGGVTGALLVALLLVRPTWPVVDVINTLPDPDSARRIGDLLMSKYMMAFEGAGLLILVGIFGAVFIGRPDKHPSPKSREAFVGRDVKPPELEDDTLTPLEPSSANKTPPPSHEHEGHT